MGRNIILASGSPRRKELLQQMGVHFTVQPSDFEEHLDSTRSTREVAKELALGKARTVAEKHPDALVIASDTIVTLAGKQLGKPSNEAEARAVLQAHAGQEVLITTSIVLVCQNEHLELLNVDESKAFFKPYDAATNERYLATNDWRDKAGGWGLQSGAAPLVERIQGRYDTILGLPTHLVAEMLDQLGIAAHELNLSAPVPQSL